MGRVLPNCPPGKIYYFSYATNMNVAQMLEICPGAERKGTAILPGYRWILSWRCHANIVELTRKERDASIHHHYRTVYGFVWEINVKDLPRLDYVESCPRDSAREIHTVYYRDAHTGEINDAEEVLLYIDRSRQERFKVADYEYQHRMNLAIEDLRQFGTRRLVSKYIDYNFRPCIPAWNVEAQSTWDFPFDEYRKLLLDEALRVAESQTKRRRSSDSGRLARSTGSSSSDDSWPAPVLQTLPPYQTFPYSTPKYPQNWHHDRYNDRPYASNRRVPDGNMRAEAERPAISSRTRAHSRSRIAATQRSFRQPLSRRTHARMATPAERSSHRSAASASAHHDYHDDDYHDEDEDDEGHDEVGSHTSSRRDSVLDSPAADHRMRNHGEARIAAHGRGGLSGSMRAVHGDSDSVYSHYSHSSHDYAKIEVDFLRGEDARRGSVPDARHVGRHRFTSSTQGRFRSMPGSPMSTTSEPSRYSEAWTQPHGVRSSTRSLNGTTRRRTASRQPTMKDDGGRYGHGYAYGNPLQKQCISDSRRSLDGSYPAHSVVGTRISHEEPAPSLSSNFTWGFAKVPESQKLPTGHRSFHPYADILEFLIEEGGTAALYGTGAKQGTKAKTAAAGARNSTKQPTRVKTAAAVSRTGTGQPTKVKTAAAVTRASSKKKSASKSRQSAYFSALPESDVDEEVEAEAGSTAKVRTVKASTAAQTRKSWMAESIGSLGESEGDSDSGPDFHNGETEVSRGKSAATRPAHSTAKTKRRPPSLQNLQARHHQKESQVVNLKKSTASTLADGSRVWRRSRH